MEYKIIKVKELKTGNEILIKDIRFNPEFHEKLEEKKDPYREPQVEFAGDTGYVDVVTGKSYKTATALKVAITKREKLNKTQNAI